MFNSLYKHAKAIVLARTSSTQKMKTISDGYVANRRREPVLAVITPLQDWIVKRTDNNMLIWVSMECPILDIDNKEESIIGGVIARCITRELSYRLYETKAGLRLILKPGTYDFDWSHNDQIWKDFKDFPVDGLYKSMTLNERCFRARLSTKIARSASGKSTISSSFPSTFESNNRYSEVDPLISITKLLSANASQSEWDSFPSIKLHDLLTGALLPSKNLA